MSHQNVACWDIFEFSAQGPSRGNPFIDVDFRRRVQPGQPPGQGCRASTTATAPIGSASCLTRRASGNSPRSPALPSSTGSSGTFSVTAARDGVHGPVRVRNQFHFAYADGTPY